MLPQTLATTLDIAEAPGKDLIATLVDRLRGRTQLLILDNCEHQVEAVTRLAGALLASCPGICLLATSRQPLHLAGELVWQVPPLVTPETATAADPATVALSEAVQLFAVRAAQSSPSFALTDQNAPRVADICRHLDGIPLAIELAAARLNVLSLQGIAGHLDNRLYLLTSGERTTQPRQRTLRATLDWSHDLLSDEERQLFRRFAVFAGPTDSATIHEVCADPYTEEWQTLLTLASLVEKSLIVFDGECYRLLETIRQYAAEHLAHADEQGKLLTRHRRYFLSLAETAEKHLKGADAATWSGRIGRVYEDMRLALDTCPPEDAETVIRLAVALIPYWLLRGHLSEGRRRLSEVRERYEKNTSTREDAFIHLLNGLGTLTYRQGDYADAETYLQDKLALCRERDDTTNMAHTLGNLGNIAFYRGNLDRAAGNYSECLELFRQLDNRQGTATALMNLGNIATMREEYEAAEPLLCESLEIWRDLDNMQGIANTLHNLGSGATKQQQYHRAYALLTECLTLRRQLDHRQGIAHTLLNLQVVCTATDDMDCARTYLREAWQILIEIGDRLGQAEALRGGAEILNRQGLRREAVELYAAMAAQRENIGAVPVQPGEQEILDDLESDLGSELFAATWTIGRCGAPALLILRAFGST